MSMPSAYTRESATGVCGLANAMMIKDTDASLKKIRPLLNLALKVVCKPPSSPPEENLKPAADFFLPLDGQKRRHRQQD